MAKRKTGRPTLYTEALALEICRRIAERESLRKICADLDMPDKSTVLRWLGDQEQGAFRDQYACAREMQADALFDEALEIADETSEDLIVLNHCRIRTYVSVRCRRIDGRRLAGIPPADRRWKWSRNGL